MPAMLRHLVPALIVLLGSSAHLGAAENAPRAPPGAAAAAAAAADAAGNVAVRKVMLFSSGVGYFEHAGKITGDAATELRFKAGQINDILKSLMLEDLGGGRIGTVVYPSLDPLDKTLKSFQVDITGNPSLAQLLNQLRGAAVTVTLQGETLAGRVLGVEQRQKAVVEKQVVTTWVLNVLAGSTVRQMPLDDVQNLQLDDRQLNDELHKALFALGQARDQDKKPVVIHFTGKGERDVRLGYVVETPVWKTSYRLVLPAKAGDQGALQGWAIVENQTDNDWNDVQLSLVSGRPISFIQDLYRPLYVPRPVVEHQTYASLRPQSYEGGMANKDRDGEDKAADRRKGVSARPAAAPSGAMAGDFAFAGKNADGIAEAAQRPMDITASVSSAATAEKLGELFQYQVPNVTLPRQRSAMLPIVTDPVRVERVSIYNARVLAKHPLTGALIVNTTGKHLLGGPVTVLDGGGYQGEASIDNVTPGQNRLLSFAIDLPLKVDSTSARDDRRIVTGKLVKGLLVLRSRLQFRQDYTIASAAESERTVVVEHGFRPGWTLVETSEPYERTDALYRFKVAVAAGQTVKHAVSEELVQDETIALIDADAGTLGVYANTGTIPPKVRDALHKAAALKGQMIDAQRAIEARQRELQSVSADQQRIRENMRTVAQNTPYSTRLLAKLNDQETKVEGIQKDIEGQQAAMEQKRQELEAYVGALTID